MSASRPAPSAEAPKVQIFDLLHFAVENRASDIHLSTGEAPAVRIDGEIRRLDLPKLTRDDSKRLAYSVMNAKQKLRFENEMEIDFSIGLKGLARFRVNVFTQQRGLGIVLRQIPSKVLSLEELHAPTVFQRIAELRKGLVLVTGPTGSGKSTTLAAIIDHINHNRPEHVLTVEDPIEFVHVPDRCIINQREVGAHTKGFTAAKTLTSFWWARCAISRPSRWPSPPPRPATSSLAPCTPILAPRPSTASSIVTPTSSKSRCAPCCLRASRR